MVLIMETKICTKCGIEKELSPEFFTVDKRVENGLSGRCRKCTQKYKKQHYKDNIEKNKQYYKDNKEHQLAYRKKHSDRLSEYNKEYRKRNLEKLLSYSKQYCVENKDKLVEQQHKYAKDNKEKICIRKKKYDLENAEKILAYRKQYSKDNALQFRMRNAHRRTLEKSLPSTLTILQWEKIKKDFNNKCAYCGKETNLVQEHFVALSKGGEYTTNNIIPSCQYCNSSKHDKNFFGWYSKYKYYSKKKEKVILKYLNYSKEIQQLTLTI